MPIVSLIAAIDEGGGLGKENKLLCHLPADLKHFKELTWGKPIIMGRKTYDSIGKPLPGRLNIVLSHHLTAIAGVTVVSSLAQAFALTHHAAEVMVIGGTTLFEQALPVAQRIYLTLIHHQFEADVFFPLFNKKNWRITQTVKRMADEKNQYALTFYDYEKIT